MIDSLGVACTFFVVPDDNALYAPEGFKSHLKEVLDSKHEVSLHGYTHKKNEFGILYPIPLPIPFPSLKTQKEQIRRGRERLVDLIGTRAMGFRAPFYLYNGNTTKALASLGFTYDSSATIFKTAHCSHFRMRWLNDCRPFMANGVIEIPVTGDYTYNMKSCGFLNSLKVALRDFNLVRRSNGVFVVNNHPDHFGEKEFELTKILVRKIAEDTTFQRLVDVAKTCQVTLKN